MFKKNKKILIYFLTINIETEIVYFNLWRFLFLMYNSNK